IVDIVELAASQRNGGAGRGGDLAHSDGLEALRAEQTEPTLAAVPIPVEYDRLPLDDVQPAGGLEVRGDVERRPVQRACVKRRRVQRGRETRADERAGHSDARAALHRQPARLTRFTPSQPNTMNSASTATCAIRNGG